MTTPPTTTPPNITIQPVTSTTLPAYRRLITTLLPIRYQDSYYAESIANPTSSSLALCAVWHDPHNPSPSNPNGEVVAGIQCRLDPLLPPPSSVSKSDKPPTETPSRIPNQLHPPVSPPPPPPTTTTTTTTNSDSNRRNLYISTLCTLSPHRHRGIAALLLTSILHTVLAHPAYAHLTITSLYAHVWEANLEALEWYQKRGFRVEGGLVVGYYRRLKPSGGRVVRRGVGVGEYLSAKGMAPVGVRLVDKRGERGGGEEEKDDWERGEEGEERECV